MLPVCHTLTKLSSGRSVAEPEPGHVCKPGGVDPPVGRGVVKVLLVVGGLQEVCLHYPKYPQALVIGLQLQPYPACPTSSGTERRHSSNGAFELSQYWRLVWFTRFVHLYVIIAPATIINTTARQNSLPTHGSHQCSMAQE